MAGLKRYCNRDVIVRTGNPSGVSPLVFLRDEGLKPLWCGDFERSRLGVSAMFELSNFITYISIIISITAGTRPLSPHSAVHCSVPCFRWLNNVEHYTARNNLHSSTHVSKPSRMISPTLWPLGCPLENSATFASRPFSASQG